jgi:DNA-binding LytR/AlgR family response regulator
MLLDDELPGLMYLKMLCEQLPELDIIKSYNNPERLLEDIGKLDFDLCITDIEMPGIDGLNLAQQLQGKLVIFTTAYKDYAAAAFDIEAIDYITKPVTKERLQKAVRKAIEVFNTPRLSQQYLQWNTDKGKGMLYYGRIVYIKSSESDSRDKEVLQTDGQTMVLKNINFTTLLHSLPAGQFCRINKKEVVALTAIQFFSHNEVVLHPTVNGVKGMSLSLSDTYRTAFMEQVKN